MKKWCLLFLLIISTSINAADSKQRIIEKHLKRYGKLENFSAIQVSIKQYGKIKTYSVGNRSLAKDSKPITNEDLFNIGSITKSYTAALAILAEREKKLNLNASLKKYITNYPHWAEMSLASLLNMTSGLPNYSATPKINYLGSKNLKQYWNPAELVSLVYSKDENPPLKKGYFYCNTGYILHGMILAKQYSSTFKKLLEEKIIKPIALENTFYPIPNYSTEVLNRLVTGYSYNIYDNPELIGRQVTDNNLSWAGAAGGMVANSEDVVRWIEHLFIKNDVLTKREKRKMQKLVSLTTGKSIRRTDRYNPKGFGLGIIQAYDPKIGRFWYYEGETLGYRALYMYVPAKKIIISALFNSATNAENDHAGELLRRIYFHSA